MEGAWRGWPGHTVAVTLLHALEQPSRGRPARAPRCGLRPAPDPDPAGAGGGEQKERRQRRDEREKGRRRGEGSGGGEARGYGVFCKDSGIIQFPLLCVGINNSLRVNMENKRTRVLYVPSELDLFAIIRK